LVYTGIIWIEVHETVPEELT